VGREPRRVEPNGFYHVTSHGVDDRPIFRGDVDRQDFVLRLGRVVRHHGWRCYALCLLDTHFHLLVRLREPNLAAGMQVVNGGHSRTFNERHGRRGALFETRYAARPVVGDAHLLSTIRYVALNPVRAGVVDHAAAWEWSTYGQLVGVREPWPFFAPPLVLAHFSDRRDEAVRIVTDFVDGA
jgi:REP element-mobilizing transposase RayT